LKSICANSSDYMKWYEIAIVVVALVIGVWLNRFTYRNKKSGIAVQLSTMNIPLISVNVSNTTGIKFSNNTPVAWLKLYFYFCTTPAGAVEAGVTALQVDNSAAQTVEAQSLGRSGSRIYLNVRNADATNDQEWEVMI